ncbi:MAG: SusD/RagB family nutrient-binding outer membrane lipoprotein [Bacteroidales bacterium]|nr:SusD/RagB family nutrient-binding outer membrane lipoprotein [Bacteroidales bacterium]MDE7126600.1 SusD/RagB family nutrient-binding outer membrane lipoprotein [Bacteroidales bacterium]
MKTTIKYIIIGISFVLFSGCIGRFEEYNTNPYEPSSVSASSLLAEMFEVYASPQQNETQYNNCMWAAYSGHVTATGNWSRGKDIFAYYNSRDDHNAATWGYYFGHIYSNLFRIAEKTNREGGVYALAQLARVFAMCNMASLQGPIPYTLIKEGALNVAYDDEETVWLALFRDINEIVIILKDSPATDSSVSDIDQFYRGDMTRWLKFANTLKLRMAIRISGVGAQPFAHPELVSEMFGTSYATVEDFAKAMAESAVRDGVMLDVGDSCWDNNNSNMGVNGYKIVSNNWGEVRSNASITSCMNGYNDNRRPKYFTKQTFDKNYAEEYVGVRSGSAEVPSPAEYINYSTMYMGTQDSDPMPVMYVSEAYFLRAEGVLKGWDMDGDIKTLYEQGIRMSFSEWEVSGADEYVNNDTLVPAAYKDPQHAGNDAAAISSLTIKWNDSASNEEKLERILLQKWIACYLDPLNGWSDYRRTGYPKLLHAVSTANSEVNLTRGQRRLRFPISEYNTNGENVRIAVTYLNGGKDSNGTDLWWAKKN